MFGNLIKKIKRNRKDKSLKSAAKRIANKNTTAELRYGAADKLKALGTPEAIYGLLGRYNFSSDKNIENNEEKENVKQIVLSFGNKSVDPLKRYIKNFATVAWPIKILQEIVSEGELISFLLSVLETEHIMFNEREVEKRIELLNHLREFKHPEISEKVVKLLNDFDDRVRFAAIEILEIGGDETTREALLNLFNDDNESIRMKTKIIEVFSKTGWKVTGFRNKIEENLPEGYKVTREGRIKSKGGLDEED